MACRASTATPTSSIPDYVPLLRHSSARFASLERESGTSLLHRCGMLVMGPHDSTVVRGSLDSATRWQLDVAALDARSVRERFPWFNVTGDAIGAFEADAGLVRPEATVHASLQVACARGAQLRTDVRVRQVTENEHGVSVVTDGGTERAAAVIIAAGPWAAQLLPELAPLLTVTRQVQAWIAPSGGVDAATMPCWLLDRGPGRPAIYGLAPDPLAASDPTSPARHPKVALHGSDVVVDPDAGAAPVSDADIERLREPYASARTRARRRAGRGRDVPLHDVPGRAFPGGHATRLHAYAFRCRALRPRFQAVAGAGRCARRPRAARPHGPAGGLPFSRQVRAVGLFRRRRRRTRGTPSASPCFCSAVPPVTTATLRPRRSRTSSPASTSPRAAMPSSSDAATQCNELPTIDVPDHLAGEVEDLPAVAAQQRLAEHVVEFHHGRGLRRPPVRPAPTVETRDTASSWSAVNWLMPGSMPRGRARRPATSARSSRAASPSSAARLASASARRAASTTPPRLRFHHSRAASRSPRWDATRHSSSVIDWRKPSG